MLAAPDTIRVLITRYNEATGTVNNADGGYHHTITLASMRAAGRHLADHPPTMPLHRVLEALMMSPTGRPDWLLAYWRRETLFGCEARRTWVAPDLKTLPF